MAGLLSWLGDAEKKASQGLGAVGKFVGGVVNAPQNIGRAAGNAVRQQAIQAPRQLTRLGQDAMQNPVGAATHIFNPILGGTIDSINNGLNQLHKNPQLEAKINTGANIAATRLKNAAERIPQSHLGSIQYSKNPILNVPAQFAASIPDMVLNVPSFGAKTIAGLGGYSRDVLSQGTNNPVSTGQAVGNIADTANNAFNVAAPFAGAGSIAELATKAGAEKSIGQKLATAGAEGAKGGGAFGGFTGAAEGISQNRDKNLPGQVGAGAVQGIESGLTNAALGGVLGVAGEGLGLAAKNALGRLSVPKQAPPRMAQGAPVYNNYDQPKNGPNKQFSPRNPEAIAKQQAADLKASQARAVDPNVQQFRNKLSGTDMNAQLEQAMNQQKELVKVIATTKDPATKAGAMKSWNDLQNMIDAQEGVGPIRVMGKQVNQDIPKSYTKQTDPLEALKAEARKQSEWKKNAQEIHGKRTIDDLSKSSSKPDKQGYVTLYRGSNDEPGVVRSGSYLTDNLEVAKQYGRVDTIRVKADELVSNGEFNNTTGRGLSLNNVLELKKQPDGTYRSVPDLYNQANKTQRIASDIPASWTKGKMTEAEKVQKSMVDEAANALDAQRKAIGGVEINSQTGTRSSTNPQWYRDFYAQHGKAPTKQDIREIAYTMLENKDPNISSVADVELYHATKAMAAETPKPVTKVDSKYGTLEDFKKKYSLDPSVSSGVSKLKRNADGTEYWGASRDFSAPKGIYTIDDLYKHLTQGPMGGTAKESPIPKVPGQPTTVPQPPTPRTPLDAQAYIKEQTRLQEAAAKGEKVSKGTVLRKEFAAKGLDALAPIEKPVEIAAGGRDKTVALRNQLDRSLRSDTIAGQFAKDNGLHNIVNAVDDTKAFDQYLLARHGQDLTANGIKTGRNAGADAQLLAELGPKYEAQAQAISKYNSNLLDKTVEYGLISPETATYLKQKYPNYVPFDRIFAEGELTGGGNGSGPASLSTQTVIQRIKGSERQVHSPLESILAKTHDVIAQGERNLAAQEIVKTADLPGNPLGLKEIKPTETIGNRPTISYLENGKKRVFETTPEVAQAAKSLNKQQLGLVGKILSYPTRVLRLGATGVNAGFALANVAKDSASAFINSSHPLRSSVANPKVFLEALSAAGHHGGSSYGELVREGAGGTSFDIARNSAKETIGKIRSERNIGTKALYTVRHPSELLRAVEDTIGRSEEFGRAMQYYGNKEAALSQGKTLAEAKAYGADAARNNTVNFARAGEYGRVVNSVLPYVNAGVQGSRTLLRNLRDRPAQTATKIAITGFLPIAATTAWALNDPKRKEAYDDIQDYEKQGNIIIVPPNPVKDPKTGRWNVIKIPVSQEIANLNNIVRNGVEALHADKNFDFAAMAGDLFGTATSLNAQDPRQLMGQLTPQAVKPGIEALTNQNLFTGNPIVPDSQKMLDPRDQFGKTTSGTARVLGNATNISPRQIDNFIRTTSGGAGQTAVNASDNLLAKAGVIKPDDIRGTSLGKSVTNRFNSAAGAPEYSGIDKALKDKTTELKNTAEYKALSPEDKASALQRLSGDVVKSTKLSIDAKNQKPGWGTDKNGKQIKLSDRQAGLLDGKTDVRDYLTTNAQKEAAGISTSTKAANPKDKYQKALDAYNKDKKAGKISAIQDLTKQSELTKLKARSTYSQDANDLYDLSYKNIINYVNNDTKNGKKLWDEVQKLDKSMTEAGYTSKLYDKYGNLKKISTGKGTGKGRKGKSLNLAAFNSSLRKITKSPKGRLATNVRVPNFKTKSIKKIAPPKRIA